MYIYNPAHWEPDAHTSVLFKALLHSFSSDFLFFSGWLTGWLKLSVDAEIVGVTWLSQTSQNSIFSAVDALTPLHAVTEGEAMEHLAGTVMDLKPYPKMLLHTLREQVISGYYSETTHVKL